MTEVTIEIDTDESSAEEFVASLADEMDEQVNLVIKAHDPDTGDTDTDSNVEDESEIYNDHIQPDSNVARVAAEIEGEGWMQTRDLGKRLELTGNQISRALSNLHDKDMTERNRASTTNGIAYQNRLNKKGMRALDKIRSEIKPNRSDIPQLEHGSRTCKVLKGLKPGASLSREVGERVDLDSHGSSVSLQSAYRMDLVDRWKYEASESKMYMYQLTELGKMTIDHFNI